MSQAADSAGAAIRRIAIVGGGTAGWSVAAALAGELSGERPCAIQLIEPASGPAESATQSTLPTTGAFHDRLGLDEDALIAATGASFKLGSRFVGWSGGRAGYFEPFGEFGAANLGGVGFHHHVLRRRALGQPVDLGDFALGAVAARLGRFVRPVGDVRSVLSTFSYALHLESQPYAAVLRAVAESRGVERIAAEISGVDRRGETIAALVLNTGQRIEADLFVDCSGSDAALIGDAPGAGWRDWNVLFGFDRVVETLRSRAEAPEPFTQHQADDAGWSVRTPLRDAVGLAYVYAAGAISDDEAASRLTLIGESGDAEPRFTRLAYGRRDCAWVGNCVALGAAAGTAGAKDLDLHLVHSAAARLLALLPAGGGKGMEAREFNRQMGEELDRLRDFSLLRERINGRLGAAPWDACRSRSGPDALEYKIRLFESRGMTALLDEEVYPESSWVAAFLGQGVWPRRHDRRADGLPPQELDQQLRRLRSAFLAAAQDMPTHADYLRRSVAQGARR